MIRFLKENGYPVDLEFTTPEPYEDKENEYIGYKCDILVDGNIFDEFIFSDWHSRAVYANGFLAAFKWKDRSSQKVKKEQYRENGDLDVQVWDWVVTKDGLVKQVTDDDMPELPHEKIKKFATENEVYNHEEINKLQEELYDLKESNKSAWDTYGSELCAEDMSGKERAIEELIDALR